MPQNSQVENNVKIVCFELCFVMCQCDDYLVMAFDLRTRVRQPSQKFPALTYCTTIFSPIYTSVKHTSFTDSYESAANMTSL